MKNVSNFLRLRYQNKSYLNKENNKSKALKNKVKFI